MKRHTIKIARTNGFFVSNNSLGTDALNAVSSVPGTVDVEIEQESDDEEVQAKAQRLRDVLFGYV